VTSHEKEGEFLDFLGGMKDLAHEMVIEVNQDYLMMDASYATYNAANKTFPEEKILMCYFNM
jgi:hypothetical protein